MGPPFRGQSFPLMMGTPFARLPNAPCEPESHLKFRAKLFQ
jgi:hypothetical protein